MATKKSSTSKTARVMNLLSKSSEEPIVTEESSVPAPSSEASPAPAPAHAAATPPIIAAMQADSAISHQVLSALEDALGEEVPVESSTEATKAAPAEEAAAPAEEPAPVETAPEEVIAPTAEPVEAPVTAAATETATADDDFDPDHEPTPPTRFRVDRHSTYVNVMETLVEEKAAKYIDLFGLCKCHRCVADVKAYALNHLTPKYVVMLTGEVIPRISVYEGQFAADVTAQILTACKIVMASPRHDLPQ